ncbi:hypothetical protein [Flavobacterium sp. AJR]|uniref:hypothetical protein n=1 Tax=Flavobacterium sp. AJR TaxID=1979369 RepID=UPI000A3D78FF|nr:hypothetical protein [Flavobacterium sp. AJR]OUL63299.1 hypothetical protein B8T70_05860 [Flavobacterium sp. AJR]
MEILTILIPLISAIMGAFIGQPIIHFFNLIKRRKLKKIENATESLKLFETYETQFKTDFILPDLKETYFYIQTGIETNERSIEKYIKFKNELSGHYTWKQIKSAKLYLDLNSEDIEIKLNKAERISSTIILIISLILILFTLIIFTIYSDHFLSYSKNNFLKLTVATLLPFIVGYLLLYLIDPVIIAKRMEKKNKKKPSPKLRIN